MTTSCLKMSENPSTEQKMELDTTIVVVDFVEKSEESIIERSLKTAPKKTNAIDRKVGNRGKIKKVNPSQIKKSESLSTIDTIIASKLTQKKEASIEFVNLLNCTPKTGSEAKKIAMKINQYCRKFLLSKNHPDSLSIYSSKGLSLYENSSLFFLKALSLEQRGRDSEAIEAGEIALARLDFWIPMDKERCVRTVLKSLEDLHKKYPSRRLMEKIEGFRRTYE